MKKITLMNKNNTLYILKDEEVNVALIEQIISERGYNIKNLNNVYSFLKELDKEEEIKRYKAENIDKGVYLLHQNIPPAYKSFFEYFILTVKWVVNILNTLNVAFALTYQNKYVNVNKTFMDIPGMNLEEVSEIEAGDTLHYNKRKVYKENIKKCSEKQGKVFFDYATSTSKDNKTRDVFTIAHNYQIEHDSFISSYFFCDKYYDIHDKKTAAYLKFISYEFNAIIHNLLAVCQLNQNLELKENSLHDRSIRHSLSKKYYGLTPREYDVMYLISQGLTSEEIAQKLYISKRTVETHRTNILQKTKTRNSIELVRLADKYNLIPE